MKRFLSMLLILALLLGMAGCAVPEQPDIPSTQNTQPSTDPTTAPSTEPSTEPTAEPTSEPTEPPVEPDFFTRNGQGLPESDQIPGYAQATDTENLYQLALDLPNPDRFSQALNYGDTLYILYWREFDPMPTGHVVRAYDITTGNMLYDINLPGASQYGPLEGGGFWYLDLITLSLQFFDASGECTTVSDGLVFEGHECSVYDVIVTPDGRYLTAMFQDGDIVTVYDLQTGTEFSPAFPDEIPCFYSAEYSQGGILLNDYDDHVFLLDPATGEYIPYETAQPCDVYRDGIGYWANDNRVVLCSSEGDPASCYVQLETSHWLADISHGCAAVNYYEDSPAVQVLDLRNNLILAEITFAGDCYNTLSLFLDNGSLLIFTMLWDRIDAYLFDTGSVPADAEPFITYICTPEELEAETARIAQEVYDATGIEIFYGSQGNDFHFGSYVGLAEVDTYTVFQAVSDAAQLLSRYPEGMLREAWDIGYDGLRIYLCGTIHGIYSGGLDEAGGVATFEDNYLALAVDITIPLVSNLPHELSHIFDNRINQSSGDKSWIGLWESLHPMSDAYMYSYEDYYDYMDYTIFGEDDPDNIWFVDHYSRTFSTEDRARIMEVLWNSGEEPDYRLDYEHILEKAKLYCYILRQCFPSCNGEEAPFWEEHLGVIDESVLP